MTKKRELKSPVQVADLLPEIRDLIEAARHRAVTAANLSMVSLYWNIGRVIATEVADTAGYGNKVIPRALRAVG